MSQIPPLPPNGRGHSGAFVLRTGVNFSRGFAHMPWYYKARHPIATAFFAFALYSWDPFQWTENGRERAVRSQMRREALSTSRNILAVTPREPEREPSAAALAEQELLLAPVVIPSREERAFNAEAAAIQQRHIERSAAVVERYAAARERAGSASAARSEQESKLQAEVEARRFRAEQERREAGAR